MPASEGAWTAIIWNAENGITDSTSVILGGGDAPQNISWGFGLDVDACLTLPPDGLSMPSLRIGDVVPALRDGVRMTPDWYGPRTITLTAEVTTDNCPTCPTIRETVRDIEKKLTRFGPFGSNFNFSDNNWAQYMLLFPPCYDENNVCTQDQDWSGPYMVYGRTRRVNVEWRPSNEARAIITIRFDAEDHRLMLPCIDESNPYHWVPSQSVEVSGPTDITIRESQCAHLSFILDGTFSDGTEIEVTFNGSSFSYVLLDDLTTTFGDLIDGLNKSLLTGGSLDQSNLLGFVGSPGPVGPGTATVTVTLGDPGDDGTVTVFWEDSVVGA